MCVHTNFTKTLIILYITNLLKSLMVHMFPHNITRAATDDLYRKMVALRKTATIYRSECWGINRIELKVSIEI